MENTHHSGAFPTLSHDAMLALGMQQVAYLKPLDQAFADAAFPITGAVRPYAIYAADGNRLAVMPSRDLAEAALRQYDLEPLSVH